ncbi:MAG: TetR family transcriptional regulator [Acidimicrobiales bacterium]
MSRTGRRPGTPETREEILVAARRAFAERGYEATSLRSIAAGVHVDPALLVHYFGSKEGLFLASLEVTIGPSALFSGLDTLEVAQAAELIVARYLALLDHEQTRDVILSLVRSAVSSDRAAAMLREFLASKMLSSLGLLTGRPDGQLRASLVVAQLVGIAMLRHVVRLDAVVRASRDELVSVVAPVIEGYLR